MKTLILILQILPSLINVIKAVEAAIPESGKGEFKLAMIIDIMVVTYEGVTESLPAIEQVISIIVTTFNKLNIFGKDE